MRPFVACSDDDLSDFWDRVRDYPEANPPSNVRFKRSLPDEARLIRLCAVVRGGGSLGRPRYIAVAEWRGGQVLREAKGLVPSAWTWAQDRVPDSSTLLKVARGRFRSPDPSFDTDGLFIYRRVAPDSRKVELGDDPGSRLNRDLLKAMGFDLGSIHAAHPTIEKEIEGDLNRRPATWFEEATEKAVIAVREDYDDWMTKSARTDDARNIRKS